jgi:hypothetical protein
LLFPCVSAMLASSEISLFEFTTFTRERILGSGWNYSLR